MGCCETPLFITKKMIIFVFGRDVPWHVLMVGIFSDGIMRLCIVRTFHKTSLHGVFGWDDVHIVLTWDLYCNDWIIVF